MSLLYTRENKPDLFMTDEVPLSHITDGVAAAIEELATKPEGYQQIELARKLRDAGYDNNDYNLIIQILLRMGKIIKITTN